MIWYTFGVQVQLLASRMSRFRSWDMRLAAFNAPGLDPSDFVGPAVHDYLEPLICSSFLVMTCFLTRD